jgi:putative addiction module component (TIGR02574 family)
MSANLKVPPEFERASKEQRIAFVQDLWDRIAQDEKGIPLPTEHQRILRERLLEYRERPNPGESWSSVRDELLTKLRGA